MSATTLPTPGPAGVAAAPARRGAATTETCAHPLWGDSTGLRCVRPVGHAGGHVYHDSTGSAIDDRHADGGHG
jgi:hypothetical protein